MQRVFVNVEIMALKVNTIVPMQAENIQRFQDVIN
jgi:hypothetical protein